MRNYSLGMRQRLGIAHALLGDPQILILDEPANGLDPAGIHWMRGLLKEYAERGGTVLLSSHLLYEVEKIADELILIGRGRIVAQGTKQELLQTRGAYVKAVEHETLLDALEPARASTPYRPATGCAATPRRCRSARSPPPSGITLVELRPADGAGLEDLFLQLTADTQRDDSARRSPRPKEPPHERRRPSDTRRPSTSPAPAASRCPGWSASSSASSPTPAPASGC